MRNIFSRLFGRKPVPLQVMPVDVVTDNKYTVVLDWAGDLGCLDAPVMQVEAANRGDALTVAREAAWHEYAGLIDDIPEGATYDEVAAEDLWYSVAILDSHAFEAVA